MSGPVIHIETGTADWDAAITVVRMFCGEACIIFDDGEVVPRGTDFYTPEAAGRATCVRCRFRLALYTAFRKTQARAAEAFDASTVKGPRLDSLAEIYGLRR